MDLIGSLVLVFESVDEFGLCVCVLIRFVLDFIGSLVVVFESVFSSLVFELRLRVVVYELV